MKLHLASLALVALFPASLHAGLLPSYNIVLDMDPSTVPLFTPFEVPTGIESTISVPAGTPFMVDVYYISTGVASSFNHVGIDLSFNFDGDTGALLPAGPITAGDFAGLDSYDLAPGFMPAALPVFTGVPLTSPWAAMLPPEPGFLSNIGGAGYYTDLSGGGTSFGPGVLFLDGMGVHLMSVSFILSGAPGASAAIQPSGILNPFPSLPPGLPLPFAFGDYTLPGFLGGEAIYDSGALVAFGGSGPASYGGGTATVVPEPSSALLLLGSGMMLALRRRRASAL